jgi:hypothetical protein
MQVPTGLPTQLLQQQTASILQGCPVVAQIGIPQLSDRSHVTELPASLHT